MKRKRVTGTTTHERIFNSSNIVFHKNILSVYFDVLTKKSLEMIGQTTETSKSKWNVQQK